MKSQPKPAGKPKPPQHTQYGVIQHGLVRYRFSEKGEPIPVPLANFTAKIVGDVSHDDGAETKRSLEIEAIHQRREVRFEVEESKFQGMRWVIEHLGPTAVVYVGTRDHARAAIQLLSDNISSRTVFAHLGWREIMGEQCYLHAGGAIGPAGPVPGAEVDLPDVLALYSLPGPPEGKELAESIDASLKVLDVLPKEITIPVFAAIWRAAAGPCDFAIHLAGQTGAGKSELAALVQQHHGAGMDARHLPGSWSSTANALEALAFAAKDAVLVVDDFAPEGTRSDIERLHMEAARILRAQGNRSGRHRLRQDASLNPAKYPRGLILSTGEDIPRAHSIRARTLLLEVPPGAMDWNLLTRCQNSAAEGVYARAFAGYVRWLAEHHSELQDRRNRWLSASKGEHLAPGTTHRRTTMIEAELTFGFDLFLAFAVEAGSMTEEVADRWMDEAIGALRRASGSQATHLSAVDPVRRFLDLLRSAIASGGAHLVSSEGEVPKDPNTWGWRKLGTSTQWQAQGQQIGWLLASDAYLDPDATFRAAQQMATSDGITTTPKTLWKRLRERGILASSYTNRRRNTTRRTLQGSRRNVLHLKQDTLMPGESTQSTQSAQDPGNPGGVGRFLWDGSGPDPQESTHENGPADVGATGICGPGGSIGSIGSIPGGRERILSSAACQSDEELLL